MPSGARVHSLNIMAAITLEIPEDIAARLRFPLARAGEELRREFAVFLVKEGILPRHEARKLAAMDRIAFDDLLAHRQVAWEGTAEEVFADADAVDRTLDK
jgi:predicted HTH domain antitoxin